MEVMTRGESTARRRALVFEDDILLVGLIEDALNGEGYSVVNAMNRPGTAHERVSSLNPDLVVMDAILAGADGWECARDLLQKHPGLKILMVTVRPLDQVKTLQFQTGVAGYLRKPFTSADIAAKVRSLFP